MIRLAQGSNDLFGGDAPPAIRELIEAARAAPSAYMAGILWSAQALDPSCLPVYYLLYKHHAQRAELDEAERAARAGLRAAGAGAGLPDDPLALASPPASIDFAQPGPARFWLFTVKALAFIRARAGRLAEARSLLEVIGRCDPSHSVGSDVTLALLQGADPQ